MKVYASRFNIYLVMFLGLTLLTACQTSDKSKSDKQVSLLRLHMESAPGPEGTTQTVSLLRADPVSVTVETEALLTEANILAAGVLDAPAGSGFAVEIEFDDIGTLIMEQYSAANPGKHFVIFGQWGEKKEDGRWLAAPLITRRINNGIISFTPDMSRDDAYRFVLGLNNFSKKMHEGQSK